MSKGTLPVNNENGQGGVNEASVAGPVLYKAGSIVFAVLDTQSIVINPGQYWQLSCKDPFKVLRLWVI